MSSNALMQDMGFAELFADALESSAYAAESNTLKPDVAYQRDPIGWARDRLRIDERTLRWSQYPQYADHGWDATPDPFAAVAEAVAHYDTNGVRVTAVESGTTTGKTYFAAVLVLWFLACFENALVVTVAPKEDQLKLHVWKEITRLWPLFQALFPSAEKDKLRIQMQKGSDVWSAHGFVAGVAADEVEGSATKAQGFHAEHMLIVFEETPGISPAILTAFKNTCRAPHNLRIGFGNPDNQLDALHQLALSAGARHVIISALDHPNIVTGNANLIPGAVSQIGIDAAKEDDGEDSAMYQSRVRGLSPAQATDALIKLEWCQQAAAKFADPVERAKLQAGPKALGVDVAQSENGDKACIAAGQGAVCLKIVAKPCPNATRLGDEVWRLMTGEQDEDRRAWTVDEFAINPEHVGIDPIGVGAATVNALKDYCDATDVGLHPRSLNGGAAPISRVSRTPGGLDYEWASDANRFANLRAQMYWQAREDLRNGRVAMPNDPDLFRQLTIVKFETRNGKVLIEAKDKIKQRFGGKSPDKGDAFVYWNWARARVIPKAPKPKSAHELDNRSTRVLVPVEPVGKPRGWQSTPPWSSSSGEVEL